jgi:hypothetical protein
MKTLIIPAALDAEMRVEDAQIDLQYLQAQVGGYIQHVNLEPEIGIGMYMNEEGKLDKLAVNPRATLLASMFEAIRQGDYIVGDVVLVGEADSEGNETGLTDDALAVLSMVFGALLGDGEEQEEGQQA